MVRGVGDAAGPEGVPDAVDFGFDFASDHWMGACLAHGILNVDAGMRIRNPESGALNPPESGEEVPVRG